MFEHPSVPESKDVEMEEKPYVPEGMEVVPETQEVVQKHQTGAKFKVMSYNLMADRLVKDRATHLDKDDPTNDPMYRKRRIIEEIKKSNSSILCLQEVPNHTDKFYQEELEALGYEVLKDTYKEKQAEQ